jgi:hypothetical protein
MMKMDQLNEKSNSPLRNSRGMSDGSNNDRPTSSKRASDFFSKTNKSIGNNILSQSKSFSNKDGANNSQIKSTAINNELKAFERLKKKQEMELLSMVQNELRAELIRKENEEKLKRQKEKEEKFKQELAAIRKEEEEKKRQKEREREEYLKREEDERKIKDQQRYVEEQRKLKEEQEKEKQRLKEQRLKQEDEKRKQDEYKKQIEAMLEETKRKAEIRQKELDEKEQIRKEQLERKKIHLMMINAEKSQRKKQKIENNLKNLDEKINQQKNEFLEKQTRNEIKKQQFEKLREIAFRDKQMQALKRSEEIKKVIEKTREMEKMKIVAYNEKQKFIQIKKEELELIQRDEIKNKLERQQMRESKIKQTLQMNEELENNKKSVILQKIEFKEFRRKETSVMRERDFMEKSEINTRKRLEKEENIRRIANMQEEERRRTFQRLNEKNQRLDEFIFQKSMIAGKKREIQDEISRKKQEYVERFDKIFRKKTLNEKTINELVKMFPDNEEVINMIHCLKGGDQSLVSSSTNFNSNKTTKPSTREGGLRMNKNNSLMTGMNSTGDVGFKKVRKISSENLAPPIIIDKNYASSSSSKNLNYNKSTGNFGNTGIQVQNSKILNKTASKPNSNSVSRISSSVTKNAVNANNSNTPAVLSEKEILKKVEEFRMKLNQGLLKLLSEERQKEDERERMLAMSTNQEERRKLERYFGYDRAQASNKIVEYNE